MENRSGTELEAKLMIMSHTGCPYTHVVGFHSSKSNDTPFYREDDYPGILLTNTSWSDTLALFACHIHSSHNAIVNTSRRCSKTLEGEPCWDGHMVAPWTGGWALVVYLIGYNLAMQSTWRRMFMLRWPPRLLYSEMACLQLYISSLTAGPMSTPAKLWLRFCSILAAMPKFT